MRILQLTDCYPPPIVGGRDILVQMLAHELVNRGHEVDRAALAGPRGPRVEMDGGVTVHRIAGWSRVLSPLYADREKPFYPTVPDPGIVFALRKLLQERRPEIN
jgi:hypothetical protein